MTFAEMNGTLSYFRDFILEYTLFSKEDGKH